MKIIDRKTLAREIVPRWISAYYTSQLGKRVWYDSEKADIYRKLRALGPDPDPNEVNRIIGNPSWTDVPECSECNHPHEAVIFLGESDDDDCDTYSSFICEDCLSTAKAHFRKYYQGY